MPVAVLDIPASTANPKTTNTSPAGKPQSIMYPTGSKPRTINSVISFAPRPTIYVGAVASYANSVANNRTVESHGEPVASLRDDDAGRESVAFKEEDGESVGEVQPLPVYLAVPRSLTMRRGSLKPVGDEDAKVVGPRRDGGPEGGEAVGGQEVLVSPETAETEDG